MLQSAASFRNALHGTKPGPAAQVVLVAGCPTCVRASTDHSTGAEEGVEADVPSRRGSRLPRPLTPPGVRFCTTAVHAVRCKRRCSISSDTSSSRPRKRFGIARRMCCASQLYRGPRPLEALLQAFCSGNPKASSAQRRFGGASFTKSGRTSPPSSHTIRKNP